MACILSVYPVSSPVIYPVTKPKRDIRENEKNAARIAFFLPRVFWLSSYKRKEMELTKNLRFSFSDLVATLKVFVEGNSDDIEKLRCSAVPKNAV